MLRPAFRKRFLPIAAFSVFLTFPTSCKEDSINVNNGTDGSTGSEYLPELEDVDDVCEKMDDLEFMSYCYKNFDVNGDGKISMVEANAVRNIECYSVNSFKGIEYFGNLETLEASYVESIDLRYISHYQNYC